MKSKNESEFVCVWKILIEWHFIYTHGSESLPHFFDCSGEIFSFKHFTANDQNPHTKLSFLHYSNKLFILLLSEIIVAVYWFCGESNFSSQDDGAKIWEDGHLFYDILFDTSFSLLSNDFITFKIMKLKLKEFSGQ